MNGTFVETLPTRIMLSPAADAAGRTGDYISLKNCVGNAKVEVAITQGNAATVLLKIRQAKAVDGSNVKDITNPVTIWANQDVANTDAMTRQTDAVNFTTSADVANKHIVFEIDPSTLDVSNGFDCITVTTGASHASNITFASCQFKSSHQAAAPPSAIVD